MTEMKKFRFDERMLKNWKHIEKNWESRTILDPQKSKQHLKKLKCEQDEVCCLSDSSIHCCLTLTVGAHPKVSHHSSRLERWWKEKEKFTSIISTTTKKTKNFRWLNLNFCCKNKKLKFFSTLCCCCALTTVVRVF